MSQPIRVLFLNTRDQCGADVEVHMTLMRHFDPASVRVFAASNSEASDAETMRVRLGAWSHVTERFVPLGRPAEALAGRGKLGKLAALLPTARSLVGLAGWVRRERIQIIHATDRPRDALLCVVLGQLTGAATVVHMHSSYGDHLTRPTRIGFERASALFGVSEFTRAGLIGMGYPAQKVHAVHNATDAVHFDPALVPEAARAAVRERHGIPAEAPLLGIVARFTPWKGQRETIEALARLRATLPELRLLIVGSGPASERESLETLARAQGVADRVIFAGQQSDVRPYLAALDLFVHPSFEEPFGLAITEAMAMERPVVACRSGALPEIITEGRDGTLVAPQSSEAVAEGITRLLALPASERTGMGQRARQTVQERFTPAQLCERTARLYAQILGIAARN